MKKICILLFGIWILSATAFHAFCAENMLSLAAPENLPTHQTTPPGYPFENGKTLDFSDFQTPPAGFGEVPFWWWTGDKLDRERLAWQIRELHEKGVAGMQINYAHKDTEGWPTFPNSPEIFSPEWWDFWTFAAAECGKYNMGIGLSTYTLDWTKSKNLFNEIIYNDPDFHAQTLCAREISSPNGNLNNNQSGNSSNNSNNHLSPSENSLGFWAYPFQNGKIVGNGVQVSSFSDPFDSVKHDSIRVWEFFFVTHPGTLNPLHPESGNRVIQKFFQPFENHSATKDAQGLNWFFNDELRLGVPNEYAWWKDFPEEFKRYKEYDIFAKLPALFTNVGPETAKIQMDYRDVQMFLTEKRYFKPIYLWHYERGLVFGCDNNGRGTNPAEYGDYFRAVRWYSAPGHDTPGGHADFIKGKVSSSIANLYHRPRVWLEGYHSLGWGASPNLLMNVTNENFAYGCTLLNLHGLYYTTHGSMWEWAPPCYHFRMPYWKHMGAFLKNFERLSFVLSQGVWQSEIAVMYPTSPNMAGMSENQNFATKTAFDAARTIYASGRDITFLDDQSLLRAEIRGGKLCVSGMEFKVYVLPGVEAIRWDVLKKLDEFARSGGTVVCLEKLPRISDRIGADDPQLEKLAAKLFVQKDAPGVLVQRQTENCAKTENPMERSVKRVIYGVSEDEKGVLPRTYEPALAGFWCWAHETDRRDITAVGTLAGLGDAPKEYNVRFFCDNSGTLLLNDVQISTNVNYSAGWKGRLTLKNGDKIRILAHDDDAGNHTAGIFFAVSDGQKTLFTTRDLQYYEPDGSPAALDPQNTHQLHRFGSTDAPGAPQNWSPEAQYRKDFADLIENRFPIDVRAENQHGFPFIHRRAGTQEIYFLTGVEKNAPVTFRATGRPELWETQCGTRKVLPILEKTNDSTTIAFPVAKNEAALIVFFEDEKAETAEEADGKTEAETVSSAIPEEKPTFEFPLDGSWKFRLIPVMNNEWGDFRLPVTPDNRVIGAEARKFRYMELNTDSCTENIVKTYTASDAPDETWAVRTYGFGTKFILTSTDVNSGKTEERPYAFSRRVGIEMNPGHQGWHGNKKSISDAFIGLGATSRGHNETVFGAEKSPKNYHLTTYVRHSGDVTIQKGGNLPTHVLLDGTPISPDTQTLKLTGAPQKLELEYDTPGRGFWLFEAGIVPQRAAQPEEADVPPHAFDGSDGRTPLAMTWFDTDVVPFAPFAVSPSRTGIYRFKAPAGLQRMIFVLDEAVQTAPRVFVSGKECELKETEAFQKRTRRFVCDLPNAERLPAQIAVVAELPETIEGGAYFAEPVRLETVEGEIPQLGDWSRDGTVLETYSGGAVYTKTFVLTREEAARTATLDLHDLCATAEVRLNGKTIRTLVSSPWEADLTGNLKEGANTLEIEVYNTLSNHFQTIPNNYRGTPTSGLIGPAVIRFQ